MDEPLLSKVADGMEETQRSEPQSEPAPSRFSDGTSLRLCDFAQFRDMLGVAAAETDLEELAMAAFEMPLLLDWSEHADDSGRIYFYNAVTDESSWELPLLSTYRACVDLARSLRGLDAEARRAAASEHLRTEHASAAKALEGWTGPYQSDGGDPFYFNTSTNESAWANPRIALQFALESQVKVLATVLMEPGSGLNSPEGSELADAINLPPAGPPSSTRELETNSAFFSARSQNTARESDRLYNETPGRNPRFAFQIVDEE